MRRAESIQMTEFKMQPAPLNGGLTVGGPTC